MKHYKTILLFLIIGLVLLYLLFGDFFKIKVPLGVYLEYLNVKSKYNCGEDCFTELNFCENSTDTFYFVSRGYRGGHVFETYFNSNGELTCSVGWSVDECRAGGCPEKFNKCQKTDSCKIILGS